MDIDVGQALETDFVHLRDELGEQELEYLQRTRGFVRDEVLPVIGRFWERAEFPWDLARRMGELELIGDGIEGYGCPEMSMPSAGIIAMELSRGPREPLYLGGALLEAAFPLSVLVDGVALNITVLSYRDHIDVGIVADRDQIDDTWPLIEGITRALDDLEAAVRGKEEQA